MVLQSKENIFQFYILLFNSHKLIKGMREMPNLRDSMYCVTMCLALHYEAAFRRLPKTNSRLLVVLYSTLRLVTKARANFSTNQK